MSDTPTFPLRIDLGGQNGEMTFGSPEHVRNWLGEQADWRRRFEVHLMYRVPETGPRLRDLASELSNFAADAPTWRSQAPAAVQKLFGIAPASNSPDGAYLEETLQRFPNQPIVAASAFAVLSGLAFQPSNEPEYQGAWLALRRSATIDSTVIEARRTLAETLKDVEQRRASLVSDIDAAKSKTAKFETDSQHALAQAEAELTRVRDAVALEIKANSAEQRVLLAATTKETIDAAKALEADLKKRTDAITETYRTHMAIKASVEYWATKNQEHRTKALIAMKAFYASLALFAVAMLILVLAILPSDVSASSIPLSRIALTVLIATLGFWAIRIIARLMLSNLHLANDAAERSVMVKSYLALRTEGVLTDGRGDKQILEALFRTAGTGIVKDDANPRPFFVEIAKGG